MPEIVSDIIVTAAKVYYAPVGSTPPADSLAAGASWLAPWVYTGYTLEATKLSYKFDVLEIMVQQALNAVARFRTGEELMFETVLAEHSAQNLALALGGVVTTTPAGAGQPQVENMYIGGDYNLSTYAWGLDGSYVDEDGARFPVRVIIWKATAAEGGEIEWDREKPAGIPLQIKALADTTQQVGRHLMRIYRVLEPATS